MRRLSLLLHILCLLPFSAFASQPSGTIIKQTRITFDAPALRQLAARLMPGDSLSGYLLDAQLFELLQASRNLGIQAQRQEIVFYLRDNQYRIDMQSPAGQHSIILHKSADTVRQILWSPQKYIEMSRQQMAHMREGVLSSLARLQKTPELEGLLQRLPPEARERARQAISDYDGAGVDSSSTAASPLLQRTGRQASLLELPCEEHRRFSPDKAELHWVSIAQPEVAALLQDCFSDFAEVFGMPAPAGGASELWSVVPSGLPLHSRTYRAEAGAPVSFDIAQITEIEQRALGDTLFAIPAGFTRGTIFDLVMPER